MSDEQAQLAVAAVAMQTDVGRVRERNEDAGYVDARIGLFVVADGMGGHGGGDVASALAVSAVREIVEALRDRLWHVTPGDVHKTARTLIERAIRTAHGAVLDRSFQDLEVHNMGTTLDVLLVHEDHAYVGHVGDSRTYIVREGVIRQITNDHTVAEVMRRSGQLTEEEAQRSPLRTVLCNSVGCAPDLSVEHSRVSLCAGDRLLMCSDGLYDYFDDAELARHVSAAGGERALAALTAEACARGGHDNITGVIIAVGVADDAHDTAAVDEPGQPRQ